MKVLLAREKSEKLHRKVFKRIKETKWGTFCQAM